MLSKIDQKIVIVTRPTQLASLRRKFNTRSQAKFYVKRAKLQELAKAGTAAAVAEELAEREFVDLDMAAQVYDSSVQQLQQDLDSSEFDLPVQTIDRDFLPNFLFGPSDIVVTVGQDGLVANTAKYAVGLSIVAVNPDPERIDGVLLPFKTDAARAAVRGVLQGKARHRAVTLAEAVLADGQKLLAFNEMFVGNQTHVSARYRLSVAGRSEPQSSSGVLVCTGAGSTGWLSSVFNMAAGVASLFGRPPKKETLRFDWEDPRLAYVVREPFISKTSQATLTAGLLEPGQEIAIESDMAANGVIFSDGIEADALEFNAGAIARVRAAVGKARLVVPG